RRLGQHFTCEVSRLIGAVFDNAVDGESQPVPCRPLLTQLAEISRLLPMESDDYQADRQGACGNNEGREKVLDTHIPSKLAHQHPNRKRCETDEKHGPAASR